MDQSADPPVTTSYFTSLAVLANGRKITQRLSLLRFARTDQGTIDREHEAYHDEDRDRMVRFIQQVDKPCIAFKVLCANRKCATDQDTRAALEFAFTNIKPTDVVIVGMWQKYKDQVAQNVQWVNEILATLRENTRTGN